MYNILNINRSSFFNSIKNKLLIIGVISLAVIFLTTSTISFLAMVVMTLSFSSYIIISKLNNNANTPETNQEPDQQNNLSYPERAMSFIGRNMTYWTDQEHTRDNNRNLHH